MQIVNTTPHEINVYDANDKHIVSLPPAEAPARLATSTVLVDTVAGVPRFVTQYGEPKNLPDPQPDTIYVVSLLMRSALPERDDLWSPGRLLRHPDGTVYGCVGLSR